MIMRLSSITGASCLLLSLVGAEGRKKKTAKAKGKQKQGYGIPQPQGGGISQPPTPVQGPASASPTSTNLFGTSTPTKRRVVLGGSNEALPPGADCGCPRCPLIWDTWVDGYTLKGRMLFVNKPVSEGGEGLSWPETCDKLCGDNGEYKEQCGAECNPKKLECYHGSCYDWDHISYYDDPEKKANYQTWKRCDGCIYTTTGSQTTYDPEDSILLPESIDVINASQIAFANGADIVTPRFMDARTTQYKLINLGEFDSSGASALESPAIDLSRIKCCIGVEQGMGDFGCDNMPRFSLLIRTENKNGNSLHLTASRRERLMSMIGAGMNTCTSMFLKAATDVIFEDLSKTIGDDDNKSDMTALIFAGIDAAIAFIPGGEIAEIGARKAVKGLGKFMTSETASHMEKAFQSMGEKALDGVFSVGSEFTSQLVDTNQKQHAINEGILLTDNMMDRVFNHTKDLTNALDMMSNWMLLNMYGKFAVHDSDCSLRNVKDYVEWVHKRSQERTNATISSGEYPIYNLAYPVDTGYTQKIDFNFNGICQKTPGGEWWYAKWSRSHIWDSNKDSYTCASSESTVQFDDTVNDTHKTDFVRGLAVSTMTTKYSSIFAGCTLGLRKIFGDCRYNQDDYQVAFPYTTVQQVCSESLCTSTNADQNIWPATTFNRGTNCVDSNCDMIPQ